MRMQIPWRLSLTESSGEFERVIAPRNQIDVIETPAGRFTPRERAGRVVTGNDAAIRNVTGGDAASDRAAGQPQLC